MLRFAIRPFIKAVTLPVQFWFASNVDWRHASQRQIRAGSTQTERMHKYSRASDCRYESEIQAGSLTGWLQRTRLLSSSCEGTTRKPRNRLESTKFRESFAALQGPRQT